MTLETINSTRNQGAVPFSFLLFFLPPMGLYVRFQLRTRLVKMPAKLKHRRLFAHVVQVLPLFPEGRICQQRKKPIKILLLIIKNFQWVSRPTAWDGWCAGLEIQSWTGTSIKGHFYSMKKTEICVWNFAVSYFVVAQLTVHITSVLLLLCTTVWLQHEVSSFHYAFTTLTTWY